MKKAAYILIAAIVVFPYETTMDRTMAAEDKPIAVIYSETDIEPDETTENTVEIGTPPKEECCPINDAVELPEEVQQYLWKKCTDATSDYKNYYAFILGTIELESTFNMKAVGHNKNGTTDRGLMQINSQNISKMKKNGLITCTEDLFDIFKNIDCGFFLMDQYIEKYGVSEDAYYAYNTGKSHGGSNSNSRKVMEYAKKWKEILYK